MSIQKSKHCHHQDGSIGLGENEVERNSSEAGVGCRNVGTLAGNALNPRKTDKHCSQFSHRQCK